MYPKKSNYHSTSGSIRSSILLLVSYCPIPGIPCLTHLQERQACFDRLLGAVGHLPKVPCEPLNRVDLTSWVCYTAYVRRLYVCIYDIPGLSVQMLQPHLQKHHFTRYSKNTRNGLKLCQAKVAEYKKTPVARGST